MTSPLTGMKVVEVSMSVFIPAAGGILPDMGGDDIKIEPLTPRPAPCVGAHSNEILGDPGDNEDGILQLKIAGAVFWMDARHA